MPSLLVTRPRPPTVPGMSAYGSAPSGALRRAASEKSTGGRCWGPASPRPGPPRPAPAHQGHSPRLKQRVQKEGLLALQA